LTEAGILELVPGTANPKIFVAREILSLLEIDAKNPTRTERG
jgi:hypothetical protein